MVRDYLTEETQAESFCFLVSSTLTFRAKFTKSNNEVKNLFAGGLR